MRNFLFVLVSVFLLTVCTPPSKTTGSSNENVSAFQVGEVDRILNLLASDAMRGRRSFSPEIELAADFIANEFKSAGLKTWNNEKGFRQEFSLMKATLVSVKGNFDGRELGASELMVFTSKPSLRISDQDGFEKVFISAAENLQTQARLYVRAGKNLLVHIDRKHANSFNNLARLKSNYFKSEHSVVFVISDLVPQRWQVEAEHEITEQKLSNVVAVLPGRSRANEYVIFSGHYDHVGVGKPVNGDSIYNGANDDASGVTAMIVLARHYAKLGPQERTLVFAAFTAEEIGGYGSQYFSRQFDPASVIAMFNIEMIGTESKWGKNTAFITGFERTDMGTMMQNNLKNSGFSFYPDPYPQQQLFFRSDNATLARLGVPAHTISTAKMDDEPHYHKVSDEVKTLDLENMTRIIEAIATSARSVIEGRDTPTRVNVSRL